MFMPKHYRIILSLIEHPFNLFDAILGSILFDQGLITCQRLNQRIV
jgi:hypothetical protein